MLNLWWSHPSSMTLPTMETNYPQSSCLKSNQIFLHFISFFLATGYQFPFLFSLFLPFLFTAFLRFTHLSVWVGWLSVVFSSVCYCPLEEISFGCLSVQKFNRCLTVSTFVSRFLSLLRTHQNTTINQFPQAWYGYVAYDAKARNKEICRFPKHGTWYPGLPANLKFYPGLQKSRFCLYRTNYRPFYRAFANNYWVPSLFFPSLLHLIPYVLFLSFVLANYHVQYHVQYTVTKEKEKGRYPGL